ncbi:MAG: capsule assembly Wzi family protein [Bacteroidales bacterium]|nr:capsule assembly Wzi family protein [Bacteroidales bacterium]
MFSETLFSIKTLVFEYLNTMNQSGPLEIKYYNGSRDYGYGNDNYYNNWLYLMGYTYKDMTIGNPLLTSPVYLSGNPDYIRNNRVNAFHFGAAGMFKNLEYNILYTFSHNYGTYYFPFKDKTQHYFLFTCLISNLMPYDFVLGLEMGYDQGN